MELAFMAMEESPSQRIRALQIFCDEDGDGLGVVSGEDFVRCFWCLCSGSGGRVKLSAEDGGATATVYFRGFPISGGGGMSFVWPIFLRNGGPLRHPHGIPWPRC
ncbi:hypothetical protein PVAP13_8NG193300 [Panicum virgatum]|uniref:Uncharacterized protein n=1 Tax=Panicum virgatum TaxID=38727 RepID=A0A8T0P4I8_PANVG|nr:hypothetical protein PVAP13_8NG193300 [Panicum virgatum]